MPEGAETRKQPRMVLASSAVAWTQPSSDAPGDHLCPSTIESRDKMKAAQIAEFFIPFTVGNWAKWEPLSFPWQGVQNSAKMRRIDATSHAGFPYANG